MAGDPPPTLTGRPVAGAQRVARLAQSGLAGRAAGDALPASPNWGRSSPGS
ncbi:hypothetical protein [Streptomyces sp. NPDC000851]